MASAKLIQASKFFVLYLPTSLMSMQRRRTRREQQTGQLSIGYYYREGIKEVYLVLTLHI